MSSVAETQVCPICGTPYLTKKSKGCPVCLLRGALESEVDSPTDGAESSRHGRFHHYEVLRCEDGAFEELGRGAMGVTYRALDNVLGHTVALKVLDRRLAAHPRARERFLREARAAARLRHANVASVFYYGVRPSDGQCFYAMELVEGETVETRVRRTGPVPVRVSLEIITQVAHALAAADSQGVVHRDLKPANLMLVSDGPEMVVKVIDFGLAKVADVSNASDLTDGGFVGTPAFTSPEQSVGGPVDARSDLYALGVTLWMMLVGQAPFRGTPDEVRQQHQRAPLPLEQLRAVPQPVVALLKRLLEKDPGQRLQHPAELLQVLPRLTAAIDAGRTLSDRSLRRTLHGTTPHKVHASPRGPNRVSVARLPVTGSEVFGRDEDVACLDSAWANESVNVVTIAAWAGVGKSTLVNHWLRRMAADHYRSAELVFGWSFYRQGTGGGTSSADEFLDAALIWFGDPDPRIGTAWEKGERLAKLVAHRRTLLVLDGLEPLQNPPGPQEGRIREPSLQALLRELAAFNKGLCVITTRMPVADIADHEGTSALRRNLEQLSSDAGAKLLRALGAKGDERELQSASEEFGGHCLALTLLGSYLTDAFKGDIRFRKEVSERLAHDVRQGAHARKVMESYQTWLGEGPELAVLRMLGLFDRPVDEKALGVLLKRPAIRGLTESLAHLSPAEFQMVVGRLRRARLLAGEDPRQREHLDTHPLVREYFGEQLRSQQTDAWKECNRRLYEYYRAIAPELPASFKEMEPLFLAVICGCNAGLFRQALHEVYIPRIQRGDSSFAANFLGARGALLLVLGHFFEKGRWGSLAETGVEGQSLNGEDQLFILMQAALYLSATRESTPEIRICYERAEFLCHSLNRPLVLYVILMGQWRHSAMTDKLTATMQIAKRIYSLAQEQNEPERMIGAYTVMAATLYHLGDFETARQYWMSGVKVWRSGGVRSSFEEVDSQAVSCLYHEALIEWHFGEIASSRVTMAEAISLAKDLNDMHGLALALYYSAVLGYLELNPAVVEHFASDLIELSRRHNFAHLLATGAVCRGWARSVSGNTAAGIAGIEEGIRDYQAIGSILFLPFFLALKAEALYVADRTFEALEAIKEAEAVYERFENRYWCAELHRLRAVFLAALGAKESEIETSIETAIRIAKQQGSISLLRRAEASLTEFHSQSGRKNEDRDATDTVTRLSLRSTSPHHPAAASCRPAKLGPRKISVSRLPVTGSHIFGREEDIAFLDGAWANQQINIVTVVAWAGVGKSTLVNHWLRRLAAEQYRFAQLVFGWSFYRQGTSGGSSSADEFIDAALRWFGDPDPRIGTAWEKGERLARLIARRRTLLILDGLEPLQNPPGPQEGRLRDPSLQALLRDLAAFNKGLCVITTRTPVADIIDHEGTSALRCNLEQLSSAAGAKLLRALGVKGREMELQNACEKFGGHCLALTLLGSFLTDAFGGDIRRRNEVSEHLVEDIRQGVHARRVMESYQTWFGEGPELSVLRMLGLFDRPADQKALAALLKSPAIPGLTESLAGLSLTEWRTVLARLRRARLLAEEDTHNPAQLETHPLVREYFGEQLRSQRTDAWAESNTRLYDYYRTIAPELPETFQEMEPLFLAITCACNAGLFRKALHEIYIPRIQRGNASFAAKVLGARGALLSILAHFFEHGRFESPVVEMSVEGERLTEEDRLFILAQAALYLTTTRGMGVPEARICYERVESLCQSVSRPLLQYSALIGQWRYSLTSDNLTIAKQIAERAYVLAQQQNDPALLTGACNALACTSYSMGDFEAGLHYATRGAQIWRSGGLASSIEEVDAPAVSCLFHKALAEWHLGQLTSCHLTMGDAVLLAKDLNDMPALTNAMFNAAILSHFERNILEAERLASEVVALSTQYNFAFWLAIGSILRGWARSASDATSEGLACIENGIKDYRAIGQVLGMPYFLGLKAEALYLADRASEALEAVKEAEAFAQESAARWWSAELHRLRAVFLTALGAEDSEIDHSFCAAIGVAREQKSISLQKRAEATYAEYRRQKTRVSGEREFQLPIC